MALSTVGVFILLDLVVGRDFTPDGTIEVDGRRVKTAAFPIGIDVITLCSGSNHLPLASSTFMPST